MTESALTPARALLENRQARYIHSSNLLTAKRSRRNLGIRHRNRMEIAGGTGSSTGPEHPAGDYGQSEGKRIQRLWFRKEIWQKKLPGSGRMDQWI
jgi:hypothetical protein